MHHWGDIASANGAIVCVDKNQFLGPENETISGVSYGFGIRLGAKCRRQYMSHKSTMRNIFKPKDIIFNHYGGTLHLIKYLIILPTLFIL